MAGDLFGPGSLDFGNGVTPTVASNGWNALLVKYDPSGSAQWAKTATAAWSTSTFSSAVVDSTGNIYVSGCIDESQTPNGAPDSVDFGNGVSVAKTDTSQNALLVKYSSSGIAQWAQVVTGAPGSWFANAVLDTAGNVYVVGGVAGTATYNFGNGIRVTGVATPIIQGDGAETAFLAKYDSSGAPQWARGVEAGSPESDFMSVAMDREDNVYVAGSIAGMGTYDFGNGVTVAGTASPPGGPVGLLGFSAVLVKYSSSGIAQWIRTAKSSWSGSSFESVAVDSAGDVYAAGSIGSGTFDFGNAVTVASSAGGFPNRPPGISPLSIVLARFDSSGTAQWARTPNPGGSESFLNAVAVDSLGEIYVAGGVDGPGTYDFGPGVAIATNQEASRYVALVKYDSSGRSEWALSCTNEGSAANASFNSLTLGPAGDLYAAGIIVGAAVIDFGNDVTVSLAPPSPGGSPLLVKYH